MIRGLIVPLTSVAKFSAALKTAIDLALSYRAHVDVIHLSYPEPYTLNLMMLDADAARISDINGRADALTETRSVGERNAFHAFIQTCERKIAEGQPQSNRATISYSELPWSSTGLLASLAFDIAVIGRGKDGKRSQIDGLANVFLDEGKSVLIVPLT